VATGSSITSATGSSITSATGSSITSASASSITSATGSSITSASASVRSVRSIYFRVDFLKPRPVLRDERLRICAPPGLLLLMSHCKCCPLLLNMLEILLLLWQL
jgi:hypothetical protein